jgi:cation-transporting ATPase F
MGYWKYNQELRKIMETILGKLFHQLPKSEVLELLETDLYGGLDRFEIEARQQHFGPNAIPVCSGPRPLICFLLQFHQALLYILLTAAAITAFLDERVEHTAR